ncbi:MAG: HAMP domain-containing histidine kinase [Ruminococcaceae bacterium]|nr:HAMP domain-containing histidine kinase [Oscillospiraceae bacterium]
MIKRLQKKFIKIASFTVAGVMLLLCVILNTANLISTTSKLDNTLNMINGNMGNMPSFREGGEFKPDGKPDRDFGRETPFLTRYFVINYTEDGTVTAANLESIAAVTENDISFYLGIAQKNGEGKGYADGYRYSVTKQSDGNYSAVFLNADKEISSMLTTLMLSVGATAVCIALITVLIILFSRKAVDPVIKADAQQKQFITDAGHELKTPITVIATSLTVLEMEVGRQKWIDKAKAQTEKLGELVNSLVSLSRMDEEETPVKIHSFDISAAVKETAESFREYTESQGRRLALSIPDGLSYNGDEYMVRRLCSILIDNAIKYSVKDSEIEFSLEKAKSGIVIKSTNECDSLDTSELDKLFDRFYRADKSRNSENQGFGIGLSMARSIAEAHKGEIKAESPDGHRIVFTAYLK